MRTSSEMEVGPHTLVIFQMYPPARVHTLRRDHLPSQKPPFSLRASRPSV